MKSKIVSTSLMALLIAGGVASPVSAHKEVMVNKDTDKGTVAIASTQGDAASTTADAIAKIESKGGLSTFFFGADYRSLGKLRSEMSTTQNNIDQLKGLLAQTISDTDKTELEAQIKVLEDSQAEIEKFIEEHESTFSVFGWFVKWFLN